MQAIRATGAERVVVTHGSIPVMVRWLCQNGYDAKAFDTAYGDDEAGEAGEIADA
jgi:putative mRNA 3-end processing factor